MWRPAAINRRAGKKKKLDKTEEEGCRMNVLEFSREERQPKKQKRNNLHVLIDDLRE
jgi:hypothetical protein